MIKLIMPIFILFAFFIGCGTDNTINNFNLTSVPKSDSLNLIDTLKIADTLLNNPPVFPQNTMYRYYKFIVCAFNLGGNSCGILTETSFINNDVNLANSYKVISHSTIASNDSSIDNLFDGDTSVGLTTGNYVKFTSIPWEWVVDMGKSYKFSSILISSHETFFYREPSQVSILGSNDLSTWKELGNQTFTQVYQSTLVPLTY